jgi:hypothetical protein
MHLYIRVWSGAATESPEKLSSQEVGDVETGFHREPLCAAISFDGDALEPV